MKIAFIHQPTQRLVPGAPHGSLAVWTSKVVQLLQGKHELFVYSRAFPEQQAEESYEGCTYVRVAAPADEPVRRWLLPLVGAVNRRQSPFTSSLFYPQFYRRVARDLAARGVDIVHIHLYPQAAGIIRAEHPSAKIVVHLHLEWLSLVPLRVARRQVRDVDLLIGCSEYVSERLRRALPEHASRVCTLYNGVDTGHFSPPPFEGRPPGERRVLFVGRLSPEKGIHVLLEAFRTALQTSPNLSLDIVGSDAVAPFHIFANLDDAEAVAAIRPYHDTTPWARLRTRLRREYPRRLRWLEDTTYFGRLQRSAVPDRVRFLGHVANEALPELYRRAAVCVMPSFSETFGIPLIEAMACGTPTIATRVGGMPEVVEHEHTGLLVDAGDVAGLANAIRRLTGEPVLHRRMSEAARARAVDRFSFEKIGDDLLTEYAALLADASTPVACPPRTPALGTA